MTKAINWPVQFYQEVISEDVESTKIAVRLGSLYFDHCYYFPGEIVDIRVDHKIIRKGQIVDDLKLCKLQDLTDADLALQKSTIQNKNSLIDFLSYNYNQPVTDDTLITLIYYKNLPIEDQNIVLDDPHL